MGKRLKSSNNLKVEEATETESLAPNEGLRILARIIASQHMKKQVQILDTDDQENSKSPKILRND